MNFFYLDPDPAKNKIERTTFISKVKKQGLKSLKIVIFWWKTSRETIFLAQIRRIRTRIQAGKFRNLLKQKSHSGRIQIRIMKYIL